MVTYVTTEDLKRKNRPMKVCAVVVESGLPTVEDVQKCLRGDNLYLNPVMYNLLISGVESGKLKNI